MLSYVEMNDDVRKVFYENGTPNCATQQLMPIAAKAG